MGEILRERVLRALGLGRVWLELEALSTRMKRIEQDVQRLQLGPRRETDSGGTITTPDNLRALGHTIPAPGGVPPSGMQPYGYDADGKLHDGVRRKGDA